MIKTAAAKLVAAESLGLVGRAAGWVRDLLGRNPMPADDSPIEEAAKERLSKSNKIQTGSEAAYTEDEHKRLRHDRALTQRYTDMKVFGHKIPGATGSTGSEDDGMLVADDIQTTTTTINRNGGGLLQTLGAMGLGAAALWGANQYMKPEPTPPPPETIVIPGESTHSEREKDYRFKSRVIPPAEGFVE